MTTGNLFANVPQQLANEAVEEFALGSECKD
jgi:hypothetical protein